MIKILWRSYLLLNCPVSFKAKLKILVEIYYAKGGKRRAKRENWRKWKVMGAIFLINGRRGRGRTMNGALQEKKNVVSGKRGNETRRQKSTKVRVQSHTGAQTKTPKPRYTKRKILTHGARIERHMHSQVHAYTYTIHAQIHTEKGCMHRVQMHK